MKFHSGFNKPFFVQTVFLVRYLLIFFVLYDLNLSYFKWPSVSCILRWYLDLIRIIVSCFSFYGKLQYTLATNDEGTNRLMIYNFWAYFNEKNLNRQFLLFPIGFPSPFFLRMPNNDKNEENLKGDDRLSQKRIKKIRLFFCGSLYDLDVNPFFYSYIASF